MASPNQIPKWAAEGKAEPEGDFQIGPPPSNDPPVEKMVNDIILDIDCLANDSESTSLHLRHVIERGLYHLSKGGFDPRDIEALQAKLTHVALNGKRE